MIFFLARKNGAARKNKTHQKYTSGIHGRRSKKQSKAKQHVYALCVRPYVSLPISFVCSTCPLGYRIAFCETRLFVLSRMKAKQSVRTCQTTWICSAMAVKESKRRFCILWWLAQINKPHVLTDLQSTEMFVPPKKKTNWISILPNCPLIPSYCNCTPCKNWIWEGGLDGWI